MTSAPTQSSAVDDQVANHQLPGWARVWAWCLANANEYGHARAYPSQLRQALDLDHAREVSRAIRLARERGVIDQCSTASCLVLSGHSLAPCEANHRQTT